MKRQIIPVVLAALVSLLLVAGVAQAQSMTALQGTIPHRFWVGNTSLPAGEYVFKAQNSLLFIQNKNGGKSLLLLTSPELRNPNAISKAEGRIVFHRVENDYFLAKVENPAEYSNRKLAVSKVEQEQLNSGVKVQEVRIALQRR